MKECPRCGRKVSEETANCPTCNYAFFAEEEVLEETKKPLIAGGLMLASALLGLGYALMIALNPESVVQFSLQNMGGGFSESVDPGTLVTTLRVCSFIMLSFVAVEIIGAILAIKRTHWGVAMLGAVLGIFTIGFNISVVLSIIAIIILYMSKDEFI